MNIPFTEKTLVQRVKTHIDHLLQDDKITGLTSKILDKLLQPPPEWIHHGREVMEERALSIQKNEIWYHSRRDPHRETKRLLDSPELKDKSHLILLGSGLGYLIGAALASGKFASLLLIEPDTEMLFYALLREDWALRDDKHIFFIFIPDSEQMEDFDALLSYLRGKDVSSLYIHAHPGSIQALPGMYLPLRENLFRLIEKRSINQATLIKFQKIWNKNILLNLEHIMGGGALKDLFQISISQTAVLAGAGPSLGSHFEDLKKHRDKFLLLAVDTSYLPLLKAGLIPDVVFSSDPQWINHHYVLSPQVGDSLWILDPVVCPAISRWLAKKKARMLWWDNPFYLDEFFRSESGSRGVVAHGGSVSTNAFDIALQMGVSNLILIGQDLSFTEGKAHAAGSVLEEMVFMRVDRFTTMEMHNRMQMTALPRILAPSTQESRETFTNAKLMVYIEWFGNQASRMRLKNPEVRLIHADPRGARLKGFERIALKDFFEHHTPEQSVRFDRGSLPENKTDIEKKLLEKIDKLRDEIRSLQRVYLENVRLISRYREKRQPATLQQIEENDKKIMNYQEANKILSVSAQNVILQITENDQENDPLKKSLLLYSAMRETADHFIYLLEKLNSVS